MITPSHPIDKETKLTNVKDKGCGRIRASCTMTQFLGVSLLSHYQVRHPK